MVIHPIVLVHKKFLFFRFSSFSLAETEITPPVRPGRNSTPIFTLRNAPGAPWEGPGGLSRWLPVISGLPVRQFARPHVGCGA
jgi:hypothetical protein